MKRERSRRVFAPVPWIAALSPMILFSCGGPSTPAERGAGSPPLSPPAEELTVEGLVGETVAALTAEPRAFSLVERTGDKVNRRGQLLLRGAGTSASRFVLSWEGDPPTLLTSDGRTVFASRASGDVLSSPLDRAGSVLRSREAGRLVPTAINPSSFGQYGAEVSTETEGLIRLRAPLPNGGGWELAVSADDRLPRRVSFRSAPEAAPEVLELEPITVAVPAEVEAYRLEPAPGGENTEFFAGPAPGERAPPVSFELTDGTTVDLEDLEGSAVALDFWATWCVPCRPAMEELEVLHQEFGDQGLRVFGLRLYDSGDPTAFLESLGVTYPVGDGQPFAAPYAIDTYGLPTLYVLDREGRVVDLVVGFDAELSPPKLRQAVLAALSG